MLVSSKEMLEKAYKNGYAVPAINTQGGTYDIIRAVCLAAEECGSPVILAHYLSTGAYSGHAWFAETAKWLANQVKVPVAIHLDHGDTFEHCGEMLRYGFTSLMYDGSACSLEENARQTNLVIRAAHAVNVPVEAEIGELARLDDQGRVIGESNMADPENVRRFLEMCAPDSLAIGIGNAHGFYKGPVNINLEILEACRSFTDVPFVLHGCTGMDDSLVKQAISYGVAKINFGTQVRYQYVDYIRQGLAQGVDQGHAWRLSQFACQQLIPDIKKIIALSGAEGKA
nr:class II fructose-bisphosphate aldolase [uncultured Oscillibacter sp.]